MKSLQQDRFEKAYAFLMLFVKLPTREKVWVLILITLLIIPLSLLRYKRYCIIQQAIEFGATLIK